MAERKVPRVNGRDLITKLPRNIIDIILEFMPIRDAVRTSILSRNWRYQWTTIPSLVFDDQFIRSMKHLMIKLGHTNKKSMAKEFVGVINKLLLFHNGPLLKFSLDIPDYDIQTIQDSLNQWVFLLSRKDIKEFIVYNVRDLCVKYHLNSYIFSCLKLTNLKLTKVGFNPLPPASGGFSYLTSLELLFVPPPLTGLNLNCPLLESLTLRHCFEITHLNFRAPNLKCLFVSGFLIPFTRTENLKVFSLTLMVSEPDSTQGEVSNAVIVLSRLPRIERLYVGTYFLQYLAAGCLPERLDIPLHHLKSLIISDVNFAHLPEVSCIFCMIRSAPNLCKLEISAINKAGDSEAVVRNFWIENSKNSTLSKLQVVKLSNLRGFRTELELIKFILAWAPVLETIFIHRHKAVKTETALLMAEEIMQFPRVSLKTLIRHLKSPENTLSRRELRY